MLPSRDLICPFSSWCDLTTEKTHTPRDSQLPGPPQHLRLESRHSRHLPMWGNSGGNNCSHQPLGPELPPQPVCYPLRHSSSSVSAREKGNLPREIDARDSANDDNIVTGRRCTKRREMVLANLAGFIILVLLSSGFIPAAGPVVTITIGSDTSRPRNTLRESPCSVPCTSQGERSQ